MIRFSVAFRAQAERMIGFRAAIVLAAVALAVMAIAVAPAILHV